MKYNIPTLNTFDLSIKPGPLEDYKIVYEYDFNYLTNIWSDEIEFIKNDEEKIERLYNEIENQSDTYSWLIYLNSKPVGHIVADREQENTIELSYNLHPDYWGKGIMKKVIECVENFLFSKYSRIIISYCTGNKKSKRLLEKLDYTLYKEIKNAYCRDGKYIDEFKYIKKLNK